MRTIRLLIVAAYTGYLVYAGLTMLLLPWHEAWSLVVLRVPTRLGMTLDQPWVRGLISAFGALHLVVVAFELILPRGLRRYASPSPTVAGPLEPPPDRP